jgi:histidinol-phosphate aminotransferase
LARGDATGVASGTIRLDSNENPNGPGAVALDAIRARFGEASRYLKMSDTSLRDALAGAFAIPSDHVLTGCGSTDILRAAVYAYTSPARPLVVGAPTFEEPAADAERSGAPVRAVPVSRSDLRLDLDAMSAAAHGSGLVYLCNPNNPTSTVHGKDAVSRFVSRTLADSPDTMILIDEAYHDFVDDPRYSTAVPLALENPRVVVARTFSKVYGLAGLRVGYAIARPEALKPMSRLVLTNGLNQLGVAAAIATLGDRDHVDRERALNRATREWTIRELTKLGYAPAESQANFVMVDLRRDAKPFRDACRTQGVLIGRAFPPLDTYARISIGTADEMRNAFDVFKRVLSTT